MPIEGEFHPNSLALAVPYLHYLLGLLTLKFAVKGA